MTADRRFAAAEGRPMTVPAPEVKAALARLDFALPGPGRDAAEVLRMLDEVGSPATVAGAGPTMSCSTRSSWRSAMHRAPTR